MLGRETIRDREEEGGIYSGTSLYKDIPHSINRTL